MSHIGRPHLAGTAGGVGGLCLGATAGAALGLLPALFTFGLSIPFGAVIGGACGVAFGGAVGTAVGGTGGGALGYSIFTRCCLM